jgi:hypothetical protein
MKSVKVLPKGIECNIFSNNSRNRFFFLCSTLFQREKQWFRRDIMAIMAYSRVWYKRSHKTNIKIGFCARFQENIIDCGSNAITELLNWSLRKYSIDWVVIEVLYKGFSELTDEKTKTNIVYSFLMILKLKRNYYLNRYLFCFQTVVNPQ